MRSKNCNRFRCAGVYWYRAWRIVRFYSRLCAGFPAALKLGLAGGPLIMALTSGVSAVSASCTGLCRQVPTRAAGAGDRTVPLGSGAEIWWDFVNTLVNGEGLSWIGYGARSPPFR